MSRIAKDEEREERIWDEAIVDANGPEEQAMGWYYYLDDLLNFPFAAKCIVQRSISPLASGDTVEVTGMAPEEESIREMFVTIRWAERTLAVPLSQLEGVGVNEQTQQAIGDWHYWVQRGYEF